MQVDREQQRAGRNDSRAGRGKSADIAGCAETRDADGVWARASDLVLGLFLAAAFELPRVLKIQNIEDAKHYTGLPVLASVPPLLSQDEKAWHSAFALAESFGRSRRRRRRGSFDRHYRLTSHARFRAHGFMKKVMNDKFRT